MVNYITKKEFESIPDDYKTTIKDTINGQVVEENLNEDDLPF